jgi:hypothetical protein
MSVAMNGHIRQGTLKAGDRNRAAEEFYEARRWFLNPKFQIPQARLLATLGLVIPNPKSKMPPGGL